jgi:hypothetical protein
MRKAKIKKDLKLDDFKEFFQRVYFSRALELKGPDGQYSRAELNKISDFLQDFQTNPPNMRESLSSIGTQGSRAILSLSSLAYIGDKALSIEKNEREARLSEWTTENAEILAQEQSKSSSQIKKRQQASSYAKALEEEKKGTASNMGVTSCLKLMSYLQQESTLLELSIAPSAKIRCTPQYDAAFVDFCTKVEENLKNMEQYYPRDDRKENKNPIRKMVETLFPHGEQSFRNGCNQVYNQMMNAEYTATQTLQKSDGTMCDFAYKTHIMDRAKLITICNDLAICNEGISLDEAFALVEKLFEDRQELTLLAKNKHLITKKNPSFSVHHALRDLQKSKVEIDHSRIGTIEPESDLQKLHSQFAKFTTTILCYLAKLQAVSAIPALRENLYNLFAADTEKVDRWINDRKVIKEESYAAYTAYLKKKWAAISSLAKQVDDYNALDNAALFAKLTNDIETDLGLHEITRKMFGEEMPHVGRWGLEILSTPERVKLKVKLVLPPPEAKEASDLELPKKGDIEDDEAGPQAALGDEAGPQAALGDEAGALAGWNDDAVVGAGEYNLFNLGP